MSKLWSIVQDHVDEYGVREAEIARRMGTSPQTLNSWKKRGLKKLPDARLLLGLADVARVPYKRVLDAALHDIRYLPEEEVRNDADAARSSAPMNDAEGTSATDESDSGADGSPEPRGSGPSPGEGIQAARLPARKSKGTRRATHTSGGKSGRRGQGGHR